MTQPYQSIKIQQILSCLGHLTRRITHVENSFRNIAEY